MNMIKSGLRLNQGISNCLKFSVRFHRPRWVAKTCREINRRRKVADKIPDIRSNYIEWNYRAELVALSHRLGESIDEKLLDRAMTHPSHKSDDEVQDFSPFNSGNNSEFVLLGQESLSNVITSYLSTSLPKVSSNVGLSKIHDHLLSTENLSAIGSELGLKELIKCKDYPPSDIDIADSFKALIHCVLTSCGDDRCVKFILDLVATKLSGKDLYEILSIEKPYQHIMKILEVKEDTELESRLMWSSGSNTILGVFVVGIYHNRQHIGTGYGETVNIAEDMAAHDALRKLLDLNGYDQPLKFGVRTESMISSLQLSSGNKNNLL